VMSWTGIFAFYSAVAVVSTLGMATFVDAVENQTFSSSIDQDQSFWFKATAAYRLLRNDPKMKYLIPTTALFGWASAFLSSYVNGEVVHMVLHQDNSIGWLTAWVSCAAALASLCYGRIPPGHKEAILAFGALCFSAIALIFVITPRLKSISTLILVYTLHGLGRATFEGTLRSAFADLFEDKEGAFANIILQNGTTTAIGFLLSFHLRCESSATNPYCIEYRDGSRHNVLIYEVLILVTAALSIWGFRQAMIIEAGQESEEQTPLVEAGLEECAGLAEVSPTQ
jgi:MFS family permease